MIKEIIKDQNGFSRGFLEHNGSQWTEKGALTRDKPRFILVDYFTLTHYARFF